MEWLFMKPKKKASPKIVSTMVVSLYKQSLMPLLDLLNLKDSAEILLCSELNNNPNYNACYARRQLKKIERIAEYRDDIALL